MNALGSGDVLLGSQTLTITVEDANDTATFANDFLLSVSENQQTVVTLSASDEDASDDVTTYQLASSGEHNNDLFTLDESSGVLTFTSAPNFEDPQGGSGDDSNDYTVVVNALGSGDVLLGSQTLTITVEDANDLPTISSISVDYSVDDGTHTVDLLDGSNDEDGDSPIVMGTPTYTISIAGSSAQSFTPSNGSMYGLTFSGNALTTIDTGHSTYQSLSGNSTAVITVSYLITDEIGSPVSNTAIYTVAGGNLEGTVSITGSTEEGGDITLTVSDINGGVLTTDISSIRFYRVVGGSVGGGDDVDVTSLLSAGTRTQDSSMVTQIFTISAEQSLVGEDIYATVSYTDGNGNSETDVTSSTVNISNVNDVGTLSAITGTPRQGEVLTVGMITDLDGGVSAPTSYQWLADDIEISGAIASTYTLTQSEVGAVITVRVTYNDAFANNQVALSSGTSAVENVNDVGSVMISGTPDEGADITVTLTDIDGLTAANIVNISLYALDGSNNPTGASLVTINSGFTESGDDITVVMTLPTEDSLIGTSLAVFVTYTDDLGTNYNGLGGNPSPIASSSFTLNNVNDAAQITGDTSLTVSSSSGATGDLNHTDSDLTDSDDVWMTSADVTAVSGTSYGTFSITADGSINFVTNNNYLALDCWR